MALKETTLEKVATLLSQHRDGPFVRGLYSVEDLELIAERMGELSCWLDRADVTVRRKRARLSQGDIMVSAYADHVRPSTGSHTSPAATLMAFYREHLADTFSMIHLLPHFECPVIHEDLEGAARRADGGYEPSSFRMDPQFGEPEDLTDTEATLMFDFVPNHASVHGDWFQKFLDDEPGYERFFVTVPPDLDWSKVARPRTHNPIQKFANARGVAKHVWCTFSPTQADLNIKEPRVFCALVEALVKEFLGRGATWIRLDAVGYLVKMLGVGDSEPTTSSFHLPETHNVVKALRVLLDDMCPSATLVAEINDTRERITTYYGDGDEAHLAYAFLCPPLSLAAIYTGNTAPMMRWAAELSLERPSLAFVSSHDGIGLIPLDTFEPSLKDLLVREARSRGAKINNRSKYVDHRLVEEPYEICTTFLEAVLLPEERALIERDELDSSRIEGIVARLMATLSFMYSLPYSVPAEYLGSVTLRLNEDTNVAATNRYRDRNRGVIDYDAFNKALRAPDTSYERLVSEYFRAKKAMLLARAGTEAFAPTGGCEVDVIDVEGSTESFSPVSSFLRSDDSGRKRVLALTNASDESRRVTVDGAQLGEPPLESMHDLLSDLSIRFTDGAAAFELCPHQVAWMKLYRD